MTTDNIIVCSGCGVRLPNKNFGGSDGFNASGECNELFNELSGFTLMHNTSEFIHQYAVDAYGAQHAGLPTKNIRVAFSLIGLCLAIEHDYTGRQVQLVHMKIPKQDWPSLDIPEQKTSITVADVLDANPDAEKIDILRNWMKAVWESWSQHHEWIRKKTMEYI